MDQKHFVVPSAFAACIPTCMLALSLIEEGMNGWQAVLSIFLGNLVVLLPMILNSRAATKYGIPFPVFCRAAFGLRGANVGFWATLTLNIPDFTRYVVIYGNAIWDPVELLSRFESPIWHALGLFGLIFATLATNLAVNVVGPANDFANLSPRYISFRTGTILTGLIGILIQPWRLVEDPSGYIFKWLVAYISFAVYLAMILACQKPRLRPTITTGENRP